MRVKIDGVSVEFDGDFTIERLQEIVNEEKKRYPVMTRRLTVWMDGDEEVIRRGHPDEIRQIRRITGYLSPTDKWNAAKIEELRERRSNVEV